MIRNFVRYGALAGALLGFSACDLDVQNPNDPNTEIVLASPEDAENLLGSYYRRWHSSMYENLGNLWGMANAMSLENYSSLANNCQGNKSGIPRSINNNSVSNVCEDEQSQPYFILSEVQRVATNVLGATQEDDFIIGGGDEIRKLRMQAFAEFLRGLSIGYIALMYDQGAVVSVGMAGDDPGELIPYAALMDSAFVALGNAITHTTAATTAEGEEDFLIPQDWIPTTATLDADGFIALIRSYRARFGANVARTPAERAAPPLAGYGWTEIIADAENGIEDDHDNITDEVNGPFNDWIDQWQSDAPGGLWHQMTPFFIGMADNLGNNYETWVSQPLEARGTTGNFFLQSSDLRFPQGATRAAQQADFNYLSCESVGTTCERYFVNRPTNEDQTAGFTWAQSQYDWMRPRSWAVGGTGNGALVFMTREEMDLIAAEGYIRAGNLGAAATLINISRTRGLDTDGNAQGGGLPAVTGTTDGGITGAACIPEVPVNASNEAGGGTVVCAGAAPDHTNAPHRGIFEAMKYEKRLETMYTHFAAWFLDNRGWGDLPEGTTVHWAVPYQDLQARRLPIYSVGAGTPAGGGAGPSTYGW